MKILFILKRDSYGYCGGYNGTGLKNSAKFVVDMLNDAGLHAKLVVVTDNNDIDREVFTFKPDVVVVEALWVVPEKFNVLKKLHPKVRWIVRLHSALPFLAEEGIAMEWIFGYLNRGIEVAFNCERMFESFRALCMRDKVIYLPNFYPICKVEKPKKDRCVIHIGSFGAIRPMKNQLTQAIAAILYADRARKHLKFYVNSSRCEQGGGNVLRNLRGLFRNTVHELIEVPWYSHEDFVKFVAQMDVVMCVSLAETFCIAAADAVTAGVALVCSAEIPWASNYSIVPPADVEAIAAEIKKVSSWSGEKMSQHLNLRGLQKYSADSRKVWLQTLGRKKSLMTRLWEY